MKNGFHSSAWKEVGEGGLKGDWSQMSHILSTIITWSLDIYPLNLSKACYIGWLWTCYVTLALCIYYLHYMTYRIFLTFLFIWYIPWIISLYNIFMSYIANLLTSYITRYIPQCNRFSCHIAKVVTVSYSQAWVVTDWHRDLERPGWAAQGPHGRGPST